MAPVIDLTNIPSSPIPSPKPARKKVKLTPPALPTPVQSDDDVVQRRLAKGKQKAEELENETGDAGRPGLKARSSSDAVSAQTTGSLPSSPGPSSPSKGKSPSPDASALPPKQRVSIYVQAFEEMLNTVMSHEAFLFDEREAGLLAAWHGMTYEARYLFVRLFIRKNGWFRIDKLGYHDEIGNVKRACDAMCLSTETYLLKAREQALLNATAKFEDDGVAAIEPAPNVDASTPPFKPLLPNVPEASTSGKTVEDDAASEASSVVSEDSDTSEPDLDAAMTELSEAIREAIDESKESSPQIAGAIPKAKSPSPPTLDGPIPDFHSADPETDLSAFAVSSASLTSIDELLGCVSLDELKLVAKDMKVHKSGTTKEAIVEALKKATKTQATLFGSPAFAPGAGGSKGRPRQLTLNFDSKGVKQGQTTLLTKKVLRITGPCVKLQPAAISLFSRLHLIFHRSFDLSDKTMTSSMLARFKIRTYPSYTVKRTFAIFPSREALLEYEAALKVEREMEVHLGEAPESWKPKGAWKGMSAKEKKLAAEKEKKRKMDALKKGLDVFEGAWKDWKKIVKKEDAIEAVKVKDGEEEDTDHYRLTYYRKRFNSGWPLTRVAYKGAHILSRFHEYDREVKVLKALLAQKHFRRGKRGAWYDRLALVLMNHIGNDSDEAKRKARYKALEVCQKGLQDPWTHLIYHNSLQRRIARLESLLPIPKSEQHDFSYSILKTATKRTLYGEKLSEGETGKKTIWRAMDGAEVSVEELSLEYYVKKEGFKGFHSENGIMTTMFCLLFWDVIFAPVDGVFEHAYQSAPLDLATDAFAIVRANLVRERLDAIEAGSAAEILTETDQRERERKTWCVGVRWDYTREDLVEIVEALGGRAVAAICRVFAEEWGHRVGGMPDLCLWNPKAKVCRFVEVKGPGDRLSETQKVWIDVLLGAGVDVELCAVEQSDEGTLLKAQKKGKRARSATEDADDDEDLWS